MTSRLISTSRIALAAYMHDLGKFAERARIEEAFVKDATGNTVKANNEHFYCPKWNGRPTHIHAAYTAIGIDLLEEHMPALVGADQHPFAPHREPGADDSLINAAAKHHRPDTYLQWVIATADRLASGFEREEFDKYNSTPDAEESIPLNHYTTRQWTLLEEIDLTGAAPKAPAYRYPLQALSARAIFPVRANDPTEGENGDSRKAQTRYRELWSRFCAGIKAIPVAHRTHLPLWLDHFDTLWLSYTHAMPSATAGIGFKRIKPNVSLYDHSRTTAALAAALWRYDVDTGADAELSRERLRSMWDRQRGETADSKEAWTESKFLLVQGDFFGVQDFIFAEGGQTQKRAAKLLRGRSFYVSLLSELAALRVLDALDLPPTSQVVNAAGKFMILAPNTPETLARLASVQTEFDAWFLHHTFGTSGIGLAWLPASSRDFQHGGPDESPFRDLTRRLFEQLELHKLQRFGLCRAAAPGAVFSGFLDRFEHGACRVDGRSPAAVERDGAWISELAADQIDVGHWLANRDSLVVSRVPLVDDTLRLSVFGYRIGFLSDDTASVNQVDQAAPDGQLLRAFDFSIAASSNDCVWRGLARRAINAHVPRVTDRDVDEKQAGKYKGRLDEVELADIRAGMPKTLNHLANADRAMSESGTWQGIEALMTLKGDVDNLGLIFQKGLDQPSFARMAALSRQVNAFFSVYLPTLCLQEFPDTYTVFAGGDDFFLIGPWHQTLRLAKRLKDDFRTYAANNPAVHFSAGLTMTKPGLPIRQLASLAESSLETAKSHVGDSTTQERKNAVCAWGLPVKWLQFDDLLDRAGRLGDLTETHALSTSYVYGLLRYVDMAADTSRPENSLWHSHFSYSTWRWVERAVRNEGDRASTDSQRRRKHGELAAEIVDNGIRKHGMSYKIALFTHLYQQRD